MNAIPFLPSFEHYSGAVEGRLINPITSAMEYRQNGIYLQRHFLEISNLPFKGDREAYYKAILDPRMTLRRILKCQPARFGKIRGQVIEMFALAYHMNQLLTEPPLAYRFSVEALSEHQIIEEIADETPLELFEMAHNLKDVSDIALNDFNLIKQREHIHNR